MASAVPWINHPIKVDPSLQVALTKVPCLDPRIKAALEKSGFRALLAAQSAVWEICCGGRRAQHDVCLCFPTGSGKTLAYALPILHNLIQLDPCHIHCLRALIVLPTKTLLDQVLRVLGPYCSELNLRIGTLGQSEISEEMEMLKATSQASSRICFDGLVDVLLCTPGRLATHLEHTSGFSLKTLNFLVLDEADHLMKRRHMDCLPLLMERIQKDSRCIGGSRVQKMIVSATVSHDVQHLKLLDLHAPRLLRPQGRTDSRYHFSAKLHHRKVIVPAPLRPLAVVGLLNKSRNLKTIVFCSTTEMSQKLSEMLSKVEFLKDRLIECSGDMRKDAMMKALTKFKKRRACVLVASDMMSRGMDVEDVDQVINYDTPSHSKTYLHRVGRTARIDRSGTAISLLRKQMDEKPFDALAKKLNIKVECMSLDVEELRCLKSEVNGILDKMKGRKRKQTDHP